MAKTVKGFRKTPVKRLRSAKSKPTIKKRAGKFKTARIQREVRAYFKRIEASRPKKGRNAAGQTVYTYGLTHGPFDSFVPWRDERIRSTLNKIEFNHPGFYDAVMELVNPQEEGEEPIMTRDQFLKDFVRTYFVSAAHEWRYDYNADPNAIHEPGYEAVIQDLFRIKLKDKNKNLDDYPMVKSFVEAN